MRHMRPVCARCVYWVGDGAGDALVAGHCHRYPPGIYIVPETGTVVQKFPITDHHQWCGEWDDDDTRLVEAVRRSVKAPPART